jgi:hypothetical protein
MISQEVTVKRLNAIRNTHKTAIYLNYLIIYLEVNSTDIMQKQKKCAVKNL